MKKIINVQDLEFYYDKDSHFKLKINQFSLNHYDNALLVGRSGSGKSTFVNLLTAIIQPKNGSIFFNETIAIDKLSKKERLNYRKKNIGFVFQDYRLVEYLSALDNILIATEKNKKNLDYAYYIAKQVNFSQNLMKNYPSQLSGGEQQRVGICRALINKPALIIADEPTGNLDNKTAEDVINCFFRCLDEDKSSLLCISHDKNLRKRFKTIYDMNYLNKHA